MFQGKKKLYHYTYHFTFFFIEECYRFSMESSFTYSYFLLLQCWDGQPEKRPNFSQLLVTISTMLEVIGGYLVLSATDEGNSLLDKHPFKYNSETLV